ncbi:MAG: 1-acyl-sn-glycerol-3-phosphate acyltransferase [Gammaproteobacteria bacterium]|nr:MAG: 1-acyl-sn-glycerol-3-phosphate acyltransferase [Gammaproteobacteria bacterium]
MHKINLFLRSSLFFGCMSLSTIPFSILVILCWPLSQPVRYKVASGWAILNIWLLKQICGLSHQIEGLENVKEGENGIILCKHQSAWETLALQTIFPNQAWVLKRELFKIPIYGWALAATDPIAINRQNKRAALKAIIQQGIKKLKQGRWIVIFPEGTRMAPGERGNYGGSGGLLAHKSGYAITPIAHNAGEFWRRRGFIKQPGVIQVRIGPAIRLEEGRKASELNKLAEEWIESNMAEINDQKAN